METAHGVMGGEGEERERESESEMVWCSELIAYVNENVKSSNVGLCYIFNDAPIRRTAHGPYGELAVLQRVGCFLEQVEEEEEEA